MLWTLLTVTSSLTLVASALVSAQEAQAAFGSYAFAIAIGSFLGLCNAWILYQIGGAVEERSKGYSESRQEWCFRALYLGAALWILVAALVGGWIASEALFLTI